MCKRILGLLLALMLLATLFVGCSAKPDIPEGLQDLMDAAEYFSALEDLEDLDFEFDFSDLEQDLEEIFGDSFAEETDPQGGAAATLPGSASDTLDPDDSYTTKEEVALYLHLYGTLPQNFITKSEARALGWEGGSLEPYAPGCCIGGDRFGNYEGLLPEDTTYTECDINTLGASSRGAERIVFSPEGNIYYTPDHYESFELLYGTE